MHIIYIYMYWEARARVRDMVGANVRVGARVSAHRKIMLGLQY